MVSTAQNRMYRIPLLLATALAVGCQTKHSSSKEDQEDTCDFDEGLNFTKIGVPWPNRNVSASFMPDGTPTSGTTSRIFPLMDAVAPREVWQREYARALATWAQHGNLNFRFVSDAGTAPSSSGPAQADNQFGDVRIGAIDLGTAILGRAAAPATSGTLYGDVYFNTQKVYTIGASRDLYTTALHELGHTIGLGHTTVTNAAMYPGIYNVLTGLTQDDIDGVQALYGARVPDAYDAAAANGTLATATALSATAAGETFVNGDLTTADDVDHYRIVVPEGAAPVLSVTALRLQSTLIPTVQLYDAAGALLSEATAPSYGEGAVVQFSGVDPGQTYVIGIVTPTDDVFGIGAYRLAVQFRAEADGVPYAAPANLALDARELNDSFTNYSSLGQVGTSLTVSNLRTHWMWDEDFFRVQAARKASEYEVAVTRAAGTQPLEIEVMNDSGTVLKRSNGADSIRFAVVNSGYYRVRIYSPARLPTGYSMTVRKTK